MLDGLGIRGAPLSPRLFRREDSFGRNGKPLSPEELQAQVHACDPFWRLLNQPARDRAEILSKISDDPAVLQQRDPAGASPLLYLALLKSSDHIAIAKEILEREESQDRITDQYDVEPYIGENILHIAIVNKDVAFAQTLLEKNKDILKHRATGSFFKSGGSCPWGELPLSFAAASCGAKMIDLLLEHGADIEARDKEGNTAMHIAVRFSKREMYEKLCKVFEAKCGESELMELERSCLRFAALEGRTKMFEVILERSSKLLWSYGPITAMVYPISFFDKKNEHAKHKLNRTSTMQIIIDYEQLELIKTPVVSRFVDHKWKKYGASIFKKRFWSYVLYLAVFTVGIILPDLGDDDVRPLESLVRLACEIILFLGAAVKGFIEVKEMLAEGVVSHFWQCSGAIKIENFSSAAACLGIFLAAIFRFSRFDLDGDIEQCCLVLAALSMWSYAFFFLLGWKFTGPFVLMVIRIVRQDVAVLGLVFFVILSGFASCNIILGSASGFEHAAQHVFNISTAVIDESSITQQSCHEHPLKDTLSTVLAFTFVFLNGVILLNLLIAKMVSVIVVYVSSVVLFSLLTSNGPIFSM
jgi:transient receptor potential cation channel subfamily V protein 6